MNVLIACERSGVVRNAFRALGHNAWSCDLASADDRSRYHILGDAKQRNAQNTPSPSTKRLDQ